MKIFKVTEDELQKIAGLLGELPAKHVFPIIDILRALPVIEEGIGTAVNAVEGVI